MSKQVSLENTLAGGFGLPTGQIVPGNGSIVVEPDVWAVVKDHPVVNARVDAGTLIVDGKGKKAPEPSADFAVLQSRIVELEATVKAKDEEIATLKAGNGGQGGGNNAPKVYEAKHCGAGSWSILDGDTEVREKLTKEQAETFNKLDADAKTKWLAENPKA